jgi:hypothetical protein
MKNSYKYFIALLAFVSGISAQSQNSYLVNFEHKEARKSENLYFYLEEVDSKELNGQPDILLLEDAVYRIHFLKLSEPSASTYMGCMKFADQAAGEELSLHELLSDSVLRTYNRKQQAIETECLALLDNKGRQNSIFTVDLNDQDRIKMLKIKLDVCACKASRDNFSALSDTLAMPRKIVKTDVFSEPEKTYWADRLYNILENALVKSCLPPTDRFYKYYQVGRR